MSRKLIFISLIFFISCKTEKVSQTERLGIMEEVSSIEGKDSYLNSPFVTAGNRLYMVGHQDGSFPDHGWHVKGEMGGIWLHPVKLMDGFVLSYEHEGGVHCLNNAHRFTNYPFANKHDFHSEILGLEIERFQFVPDNEKGMVVEYLFKYKGDAPLTIPLKLQLMTDLRPVWLGERTGLEDGEDRVFPLDSLGKMAATDSLNGGILMWKASLPYKSWSSGQSACSFERRGKGMDVTQSFSLQLRPGESSTFRLFISGGIDSLADNDKTLWRLESDYLKLLESKKERYEEMNRLASIEIPDRDLQQVYNWTKYNTDWLVRSVSGMGTGLSAGMADYPWWFGCDNTYSQQGVLATGQPNLAIESLRLLKELSEEANGNGRVVHEVSTNGAVFNPGNINETPHFSSMIRTLYDWTGDRKLVEEFYPFLKKGMKWLLDENDKDNNLLPDGFGMMEIHGLNSEMIDVAVYTQQGFEDLAYLAKIMGEEVQAAEYNKLARQLKEIINTDFWVGEFSSYADFIGTTAQARHLIDDAIIRADTLGKPWSVSELESTKSRIASYPANQKQGFVLHHNWVVNTPMEMAIADSTKAIEALETASQFINYFGAFVTGIDRDESAGKDDGSFAKDKKIFTYTGAVMTLPTGVLAISENNYGRPDRALTYLQKLIRSFSYALPGSMYEVSPDFGMMSQAWNIYAINYPIVTQFFGIKPQAGLKKVLIDPQMPSRWNEAKISHLKVGQNDISFSFKRDMDSIILTIEQKQSDWGIILPVEKYSKVLVNGKEIDSNEAKGGNLRVELIP